MIDEFDRPLSADFERMLAEAKASEASEAERHSHAYDRRSRNCKPRLAPCGKANPPSFCENGNVA